MLKTKTYSENNGRKEANGWANNFAVAWVLVGTALKANNWEWEKVTHLDGFGSRMVGGFVR